MEKVVVGPAGVPLVEPASGTVVGFRVAEPVRMVSALPVLGSVLTPAVVTQGVVEAEVVPEVPFNPPPGFTDSFPTGRSGDPGGPLVVRAGVDWVYVARMVWATPER